MWLQTAFKLDTSFYVIIRIRTFNLYGDCVNVIVLQEMGEKLILLLSARRSSLFIFK